MNQNQLPPHKTKQSNRRGPNTTPRGIKKISSEFNRTPGDQNQLAEIKTRLPDVQNRRYNSQIYSQYR